MKQPYQNQQAGTPTTRSWDPPAPDPKSKKVPQLTPTTAGAIFAFNKTLWHVSDSYAKLLTKDGFEKAPNDEHLKPNCPVLKLIPHPHSDFQHTDPPPEDDAALQKLPLQDQEAYHRLKLAFDWLVCKTSELMGAINDAVEKDNVADYTKARDAYVAFVTNLENRHPGAADIDPQKGYGYGRNFVWTSIDALIQPDSTGKNYIMGARFQGEWNPLISSSSIPVRRRG